MSTEGELRQLLADSCRILFRLGLVDYMGHPSVRIPGTDRVLIKPQHSLRIKSQDRITPDDMVVIDLEGNPIEGNDRPPGERFIHTCIYRARPDVQAVVHTHQPMATVMGIASTPILPILHVESALMQEPIPLWPCAKLVTDNQLGQELAQTLGEHSVCHLQGHGIVSVAATVQEATIGAIWLEHLAEANWRVRSMGREPRVIPSEEIQQREASGVGWQVRWAYYREVTGCEG